MDQRFHRERDRLFRRRRDLRIVDHHRPGRVEPLARLLDDAHATAPSRRGARGSARTRRLRRASERRNRTFRIRCTETPCARRRRCRCARRLGPVTLHCSASSGDMMPTSIVRSCKIGFACSSPRSSRMRPGNFSMSASSVRKISVGQIAVDAADAHVVRMHARAAGGFLQIENVLAQIEAVEKDRDRAEVDAVRSEPHAVRGDARQLHRAARGCAARARGMRSVMPSSFSTASA